MNIGKKTWCRTYQGVMKAAIPFMPYRKPEILPSVKNLPLILKKEHISTVLIITDRGIRGCGLTMSLENVLRDNGIKCLIYDRTVPNPTSDNVEEARSLYIKHECQALIGFGGGSSIDCAKAVGARIVKPKQSLKKMGGILKVHKKLPLMIAVPTTAGTGSEVTVAAVITDAVTHHKYAITDFCLIPRFAVLDPELTRSLPKSLTSTTALDALTHAVEAYIGRSTTKETRAESREAVQLIFKSLERAYENGSDMDARRDLLRAAYLAGCAFTKSYVGYVHAVAHSLSGKYNLAHGYTNAVLLPTVLEAYGSSVEKKLTELAVCSGLVPEGTSSKEGAKAFIARVKGLNDKFGIPSTFPEIRSEDIKIMAKWADEEANPLYPVPVLWDAEELERIYHLASEEKTCREKNLNRVS